MGIRAMFTAALKKLGMRVDPATQRFWEMGRQAGTSWWERLHGYAYARWPYDYIGSAIGERAELRHKRLFFAPFLIQALFPQRWGAGYHGKVMPTVQAKRLVQIQEPINQTLSEQVIPFETARDLVIVDPDHLVALDCPCRLARQEPCLPLDVCLIVGEPFAGFILAHHPERSRRIDASEAVAIIEAEAQRGHVHHAFFKQAMLGRFYAICNCCSCCCGAISAHRNGVPMLISSGYVAQVNPAACRACGTCVESCHFGALSINSTLLIDSEQCMGCGICTHRCPEDALALIRDETKPVPLSVPGEQMPTEMTALLDR